jgi:hypothetical protein
MHACLHAEDIPSMTAQLNSPQTTASPRTGSHGRSPSFVKFDGINPEWIYSVKRFIDAQMA